MSHRPRRLHLLLAAGALLLASQLRGAAAPAQPMPDPRAGQVDALFAHLNRSPSPGLAVAVVRDGKAILRRGYGLASVEHRVRVTPSTVFDVASVAKMFTGLAVAVLVTEGTAGTEGCPCTTTTASGRASRRSSPASRSRGSASSSSPT